MEAHRFVAPRRMGELDFVLNEQEAAWQPPPELLRDQRQAFYGPITEEMVQYRAVVGGGTGDSADGPRPERWVNHAGAAARSQSHWAHGQQRVLLGIKSVKHFERTQFEKMFAQWQHKAMAPFPVPADPSEGPSGEPGMEPDGPAGGSLAAQASPPPATAQRGPTRADRMAESARRNNRFVQRLPSRRARARVELINNTPAYARLFCFHWEGGNGQIFCKFSNSAHFRHTQVVAVQLPGRLGRMNEAPLPDVWAMAAHVVQGLVELGFVDEPFAFLGHGLGALVMYETARILRKTHSKKPKAMFALSCPNPQSFVEGTLPPGFARPPPEEVAPELRLRARSPFSRSRPVSRSANSANSEGGEGGSTHGGSRSHTPAGSDDEGPVEKALSEEADEWLFHTIAVVEHHTVSPELRNSPPMFALALPLWRSDLKAMETYHYTPDWPFTCNICAVIGADEERWPASEAENWSSETTREFDFLVVPGGSRSMLREPAAVGRLAEYVEARLFVALRDSVNEPVEVYVSVEEALNAA